MEASQWLILFPPALLCFFFYDLWEVEKKTGEEKRSALHLWIDKLISPDDFQHTLDDDIPEDHPEYSINYDKRVLMHAEPEFRKTEERLNQEIFEARQARIITVIGAFIVCSFLHYVCV